jgi:hypothetical protein
LSELQIHASSSSDMAEPFSSREFPAKRSIPQQLAMSGPYQLDHPGALLRPKNPPPPRLTSLATD